MADQRSPSGPYTSVKGIVAIPSTAVATTAAATATGSFTVQGGGPNVAVGNVLSLVPQANLTASIAVAWSRVVATGIIAVGFTNVGASTAQAAVTFDADAQIQ